MPNEQKKNDKEWRNGRKSRVVEFLVVYPRRTCTSPEPSDDLTPPTDQVSNNSCGGLSCYNNSNKAGARARLHRGMQMAG